MAYIKVLLFFTFSIIIIFVPPLLYFYESDSVSPPASPIALDVASQADGSFAPPPTSILVGSHKVDSPCQLILKSDSDYMYYANVVNDSTGDIVASCFLRSGGELLLPLDKGFYRVKFTVGSRWYGLSGLFGRNSEYYDSVKPFVLLPSSPANISKEVLLTRKVNKDFPFVKIDKKSF